jgi:hypothetical protein
MSDPFPFEVVDSSGLTDADWLEIGNLKQVYEKGGDKALQRALDKLEKYDPIRRFTILSACFPQEAIEAFKDEMAERGLTLEDLRELIRKLESPARDQ